MWPKLIEIEGVGCRASQGFADFVTNGELNIWSVPDDAYIFGPSNNKDTMKQGDYIFYKSKEHGLYPTIVDRIKGDRVRCEGPRGQMIWVSISKCQLQEEWRKENEL